MKSVIAALAALLLLLGCATDVKLTSKREPGYQKSLSRVLLVLDLSKTGVDQGRVGQALSQGMAAKGSLVETMIVGPLDLNPSIATAEAAARFKATQMLTLELAWSSTDPRTGAMRSFTANASLYDAPTRKRVWRAEVVQVGTSTGEELANAVVKRLGEDGLL